MDVDLKRLKTCVAVADSGTILRAAQILRVTQPALSRQIKSLERELGFTLFDRAGRRLVLTTRGKQFLADCRSLLEHSKALNDRAVALRKGDINVLRVAVSAPGIEGAFPTFLKLFSKRVPGVQLQIIEQDDPNEHLKMLERGEAHVSMNVVNNIRVDETRFAVCRLPPFRVLAACAPSIGIKRADTIDIRETVKHPLLLPNAAFATRVIFDAACRLAGVVPTPTLESRTVHALIALAEAGHGLAVFPSILRADNRALDVMSVTHLGKPLPIFVCVLWDKQRAGPRHAEEFAALLDAHVRKIFPPSR